MYGLDGERMLMAWERGRERSEPWRALALLETALPDCDAESLSELPLAERNALLLKLRSITFGQRLEGFAVCPECGTNLEFEMNADALEGALRAPGDESWTEHETEIRMRPVNSRDIAAAMFAGDDADARTLLLERTVSPRSALSLEEFDAADDHADWLERFERLNASAEIRCVLHCSACGQRPVLDFDIAQYFWREVSVAARRLLAEIHRLARAYGWSEQAIVAMSAKRRATYLEMLDA